MDARPYKPQIPPSTGAMRLGPAEACQPSWECSGRALRRSREYATPFKQPGSSPEELQLQGMEGRS